MLKSLYSGVSGMKGFQTKLDVIGNNIANVNTVGFKKSRVMFQDIINQNISGSTGPTAKLGGVNPKQVGLGSKVGSIDTIHTPGSPMTTNVGSDLAIDGDAYFVVKDVNGNNCLTKAGNFTLDSTGTLVNANGYLVSGVANGQTGIKIQIPKDATSYSIDNNGYVNVVGTTATGKLAFNSAQNQYYIDQAGNSPDDVSLATAVVANPEGLQKVGNTMFQETANSGTANIDRIQNNNGGNINSGVLEMSNVDLTEEFTEMIVAQRGFQANARTITTSDSILQEIVDLKRQ